MVNHYYFNVDFNFSKFDDSIFSKDKRFMKKDVRCLKGILYDSKRPKISIEDMNNAVAKMGLNQNPSAN